MEHAVLGAMVVAIEMTAKDICRIQCSVFYVLSVSKPWLLYRKSQVGPIEGEGRLEPTKLRIDAGECGELTWKVSFPGLWPASSETPLEVDYP